MLHIHPLFTASNNPISNWYHQKKESGNMECTEFGLLKKREGVPWGNGVSMISDSGECLLYRFIGMNI